MSDPTPNQVDTPKGRKAFIDDYVKRSFARMESAGVDFENNEGYRKSDTYKHAEEAWEAKQKVSEHTATDFEQSQSAASMPILPSGVDALDEILTTAFNDFYDYITEADMVKAAHEYSEKTAYKKAKAKLSAREVAAEIKGLKIIENYPRVSVEMMAGVLNRIKELEKLQGGQ